MLPFLLGSLILILVPALATAVISLTHFNAVQPPVWAGLDNYRRLWASPLVRLSLRNSLGFLLLVVPLRLVGALVLALVLQPRRKPYGLYRAAVYLPTVIPEPAYALVWLWILNPIYGPINMILAKIGLPTPAWLVEPGPARLAIALMLAFQLGEGLVLVLAGLQTIPRSLYEAARVDGANAWHSFWRITMPMLAPWLMLLTFRDLVMSLQNTFTPSYMLTYGGPYYATTYVPLLIYELAFDFFDLGLAAALLMLTFLLICLLALGILNLVGLRGEVEK